MAISGTTALVDPELTDPPDGAAVGDWDGDGELDLAVSNRHRDTVSIYFHAGGQISGAPITIQTGTGSGPSFVAASDLDRDGDLDLAVALQGTGRLLLLLNHGDGTFAASGSFSVGQFPSAIAVRDFDGDRDVDLAVSSLDDGGVSLLMNNGDGDFALSTGTMVGEQPATASEATAVAVGGVPVDSVVTMSGTGPIRRSLATTAPADVIAAPTIEPSASLIALGDLARSQSIPFALDRSTKPLSRKAVRAFPGGWYVACPSQPGAMPTPARRAR